MEYAKSIGIQVLPPCINKSRDEFRVENGSIRFGLGGIKNIGVGVVKQIVEERERGGEFVDMTNLFERCASFINKRLIENFIKGGAFDCFKRTRADMMQWYGDELNDVSERHKRHQDGQISLFDMIPDLAPSAVADRPQVKEFPKQVLYNYENEVLGLYMTGSPLDEYDEIASKFHFDFNTSETAQVEVEDEFSGETTYVRPDVAKRFVTTGGILREIRVVVGKENNRMGFAVLEDKYDSIEIALYGATYEKFKTLFAADSFVVIKGMIAESRDGYKLNVRELINPHAENKQRNEVVEAPKSNVTLWLKMDVRDDDKYSRLLEKLHDYEGDVPVKIKLENKTYLLPNKVRRCSGIEYELAEILGDKNVVFVER